GRGVGEECPPRPQRLAQKASVTGHDPPIDDPDLSLARTPPPEPPNLTGRPLGDLRAGGIVTVPDMDVFPLLTGIDRRLRLRVRLERAVPVEMIGGNVEEDRDLGVKALLERQLERGGFHRQSVEALLPRGEGEGVPDVAARS